MRFGVCMSGPLFYYDAIMKMPAAASQSFRNKQHLPIVWNIGWTGQQLLLLNSVTLKQAYWAAEQDTLHGGTPYSKLVLILSRQCKLFMGILGNLRIVQLKFRCWCPGRDWSKVRNGYVKLYMALTLQDVYVQEVRLLLCRYPAQPIWPVQNAHQRQHTTHTAQALKM